MMETIKITLKLKSPIVSKFQSDTIFGHFAWGVRFCYGKERLKDLLQDFTTSPFIVFSDGFKRGYFPKPYLEPYLMPPNSMDLNKRYKKMALVPKSWILDNIDNLSDRTIFDKFQRNIQKNCEPCEECKEPKKKKDAESVLTLKNSIDRRFNRVVEGLYGIKETFYKQDFEVDVYAKFDPQKIELNEIKRIFSFIGKRGYGKDKSAGKGKFDVEIFQDFEEKSFLQPNEKRNFYLSLSTMFKDERLHLSYGKKFTKFPKAGGYLASSFPFKNPIVLFQAGSTFMIEEFDHYYGAAKSEVFQKAGFFHSGYGIGIYFGVKDGSV